MTQHPKQDSRFEELAKYLVNLYKSLGKTMEQCLDVVCWYTMTETQAKVVEDHIKDKWNK
jgi:hypothetical protein